MSASARSATDTPVTNDAVKAVRHWNLYFLLIVGSLLIFGCSTDDSDSPSNLSLNSNRSSEPEKNWQEQSQAVISGVSDTIEITAESISDEQFAALQGNKNLRQLSLEQGLLTDRSAEVLASFPKLLQLKLRESAITDASMPSIRKIESLMFLNIPQAEITFAGIHALAGHPNLQQLRIGGKLIDDKACLELIDFPELRYLHLIGPKITAKGVQHLALIPKLQSLYIDDCLLTEEAWDQLLKQRPDVHFHLDQEHLDRDPAKHPH